MVRKFWWQCAVVLLAVALVVPVTLAGGGHAHGPSHGGVIREIRHVSYELVALPDSLTLYAHDHGKPLSLAGASAEAVIYAGNEKTTVTLQSLDDVRLHAAGVFRVGVGTRVVIALTIPGKDPVKAIFNLK